MNNARLETLLRERLPGLEGRPGLWQAEIDELIVYVMTDESYDRMRIMIPVGEISPTDADLLWTLLSANFDRALDAKYAVNDGVLWSTFLHRLSWLTASELDAAIHQVTTLARNTGTSFASGDLVFGSSNDEE
jgi:hypothetical protein